MLTRRPLIPHLRVRAWDSGTDYVHRDLRERETMFRTIRLTAAALAVAIASLALAGTASAHPRGVAYEFRGAAVVAPGTGATQIQVQVTGGNRPALKALIGTAQPTTFTTGRTRWIVVQGNTPLLGSSDSVLAGDIVRVVVRAPFHTALATLVGMPAASVTDLSARTRPAGRLFLFGATAAAIDTTAHTITVDVNFGNWRALFAMLGQPVRQTFKYDANTVFLKWRHRVPIGVDPTLIHAGDPLTLRIFGPTWNTSVATLLTTSPLWRVKLGEPIRLALRDGAELPGT
jgi:hypothetical protein